MPDAPSRTTMRWQWRLHRLVWKLSGGRLGRRAVGMRILELVTTGHRSGKPRSILISHVDTPTGPALAGTNVGSDRDPAWIRNLRAQPRARVRQEGKWRQVHARFLEGEEWEQVWSQFTQHSGYAAYREMTDRAIPLVVLESPA